MDRMVPDPRTFREMVEADLRRAARLVISVQDEIDWHFRMGTPDGDYSIAVTMPNDPRERTAMLRRLSTLMAWKQALCFTMACETYTPDAVYCIGISPRERHNCISRIKRHPTPWTKENFGSVEWLQSAQIDPVIIELLPTAPRALTPKDVSAANKWFGSNGTFPAVHVPTGELRGM